MRKLMLLAAFSAAIATGLAASAQAQNCINCQTGNRNWTGQSLVNSAQRQRNVWAQPGVQRNCARNGVCPR